MKDLGKAVLISQTLTVKQLRKLLAQLPQDALVFTSSDSEGNSYATLSPDYSISYCEDDHAVMLMAFADHLDFGEIAPRTEARIVKELEEEAKNREKSR